MPERRCPACQTSLVDNVSADGICLTCGHDLAVTAPPPNWYLGNLDLRAVARWQRRLLWIILLAAVLQFGPFLIGPRFAPPYALTVLFGVSLIFVHLVGLVFTIFLMSALRYHILIRIILIVLMFAPCINLLVLVGISGAATIALRAAGLRVGLLGVRDEEVVRMLGANRCRHCGYMLISNTTGICPECGQPAATGTG